MSDQESGSGPSAVPAEIRELLEQRATYREWIRKLEEMSARARPEVQERVRSDYRERLAGVEERLAAHDSELRSTLQERQEALAELESSREKRVAALEEAELRHAVGEYDEEAWAGARSEHQEALDALESDLAGQRGAVAELRDVLAQLRGREPAAGRREEGSGGREGGIGAQAASSAAESSPPESPAEEAETAAEPWAPSPAASSPEATSGGPEPRPAAAGERTAEESENPEEFEDELEFLESLSLEEGESMGSLSWTIDEEEGEEGGGDRPR